MLFKRAVDMGAAFADRFVIQFDTDDVYFMSGDANQPNGCCIYAGNITDDPELLAGGLPIARANLPEGTRKQIETLENQL